MTAVETPLVTVDDEVEESRCVLCDWEASPCTLTDEAGKKRGLEVRPGSGWLWAALLFSAIFRQWAYTVLASLYALSPDDYDDAASVRGATGLTGDEYADIVYAYTILAVAAMGASGACAAVFGARRTAVVGLALQVAGCACCAVASGVWLLAAGTLVLSVGFGVFLTPAFTLVFGIERSGRRRVLATTTVQAASNIGAAAASLSIVVADSALGWRGCYALIAAGLGAGAVALASAPDGQDAPPRAPAAPGRALAAEVAETLRWLWRGRAFYAPAIAASTLCGCAGTLEGTWIATYFLDNYPYYADLYSYLTAFVVTIGIGFGFLLVAGALVDRAVAEALCGAGTLLVVPGVALMLGAPCKALAVLATSNFPLAFAGEAAGKAFDAFNEAPLYVALQLTAPPRHRPTAVGLYLFAYWLLAATAAEVVNDGLGLDIYQVLLIGCALQFCGGAAFAAVGGLEYPAAATRAAEAAHAGD